MQASAEERNSSDEAELAFSLPTGCRPSAASCRAIPPWPRRWIRRIVRAGPEVLQVQGRLNIGRHIDACADKGATDAEVPLEGGGIAEFPEVPVEPNAVEEQWTRISHRRIVWSLIIYCKQTVIEIFGKRQKYRVFFRSGPFFVRRREGLHGFGEPLQGAPCRRPVFPVLQHIDDRLVG